MNIPEIWLKDLEYRVWDWLWYSAPINRIETKEQLDYYLKVHFMEIINRIDRYSIDDGLELVIDYPKDDFRFKLIYNPNEEVNVWKCIVPDNFRNKLLFQTDELQGLILGIIQDSKVSIDDLLERGLGK